MHYTPQEVEEMDADTLLLDLGLLATELEAQEIRREIDQEKLKEVQEK